MDQHFARLQEVTELPGSNSALQDEAGQSRPGAEPATAGSRHGADTKAAGPGSVSPVPAARPGMRFLPGGAFRMGSARFYPEEAPVRRVAVDAFWIDEAP
ncbi:MAG: SUMF1/EgtB/PvdO family nonheme iron enzyme, partial [Pigmentiphaga sp.]